jgi:hypothetical protein
MLLDSRKTKECFLKIRQIKEHRNIYCLSRDAIPVSAEDLFWVIGDMYNLKIDKVEVVFESEFLNSLVERFNNQTANVFVKYSLNKDGKRFAAVKELMHLALDEREDWSVDGTKTLGDLFVEMSLGNGHQVVAANAIQSEALAEIAAIEILYPYEFRAADKEALLANKTTLAKLALEYDVPPFIISKALSNWFNDIATQMWGEIKHDEDRLEG